MAMRATLAGRLLCRSSPIAHQWKLLSAAAPEQPQLPQHSHHQFTPTGADPEDAEVTMDSRYWSADGSQRGFASLGLGFKGSTTGKRFFGTSSVVQQQSLVTPNEVQEELGSGAETTTTAELKSMQLKSINEARARIFGHVIGNGERSAHKVLRRKMIGHKIASWYPAPIQKQDPMFEDPKIKRRVVKNERLKRRGKGPPKKGHGKRAAKRAK